jgi:ABC-type multidrug transport system permease subunit
MLRDAWFIARKDVQYLLRQRETLLWTFAMPFVFFYFIGTITGGFRGASSRDPLSVRLPADAGPLAGHLLARLDTLGYDVIRPASEEDLARSPRRITIPAGFTDSVLAGRRVTVTLDRQEGGAAQGYDEIRIQRALYTVLADVMVAREAGLAIGAASLDSLRRIRRPIRLAVSTAGKRRAAPSGFSQAIPGTMTMFTLLIMLTSGAVLLVTERRQGLLRRMAATPISRRSVVLGKWGGRMALGLTQIGFALVAGTLFFGMDWGRSLPMVAAVLAAYAGLNASLGLLLGNLAATEAQAVGVGVLASNLLAALGGCWWPIEITPRWMQSFSLLLPTGWAMDAMHRLVSFDQGAASAVPHVAFMAAATVVVGSVAARIFRYQ